MPNKRRRSACKSRGRRAVDAWRRAKRATKRKEKKQEEAKHAFSLEFDSFALKPMDFGSNVFRSDEDTANPETNSKNVSPSEIKEKEQKTSQEEHQEAIGENDEWHADMKNLFAVKPKQHRKNHASRASF